MPEEVNKEQTKAAKQQKITDLSDDQLDEAAGGSSVDPPIPVVTDAEEQTLDLNSGVRYAESFRKN